MILLTSGANLIGFLSLVPLILLSINVSLIRGLYMGIKSL